MIDGFYDYLVSKGYTEYTKSGRKSTVYSYCNRIEKICERENVSIQTLGDKIDYYITRYDIGGVEEEYGLTASKTPINALKAYKDYLEQ